MPGYRANSGAFLYQSDIEHATKFVGLCESIRRVFFNESNKSIADLAEAAHVASHNLTIEMEKLWGREKQRDAGEKQSKTKATKNVG